MQEAWALHFPPALLLLVNGFLSGSFTQPTAMPEWEHQQTLQVLGPVQAPSVRMGSTYTVLPFYIRISSVRDA
jgi:hypothetical protein